MKTEPRPSLPARLRALATRRVRVIGLLALLLAIAVYSSVGALLTAREMERHLSLVATGSVPALVATGALETAISEQRGLVTAYMLEDGRGAWLDRRDLIRATIQRRFDEVAAVSRSDEEARIFAELRSVYDGYDRLEGDAIARYRSGQHADARRLLLNEVLAQSDRVHALCVRLAAANRRLIASESAREHQAIGRLAFSMSAGLLVAFVVALALLGVVVGQVLRPMRRLAEDARAIRGAAARPGGRFGDEFVELEDASRELISHVVTTRSDLAESRERLLTAEKLASVGRFAAAAAHDMRTPLSSMKIWLWELKRAVGDRPEALARCVRIGDEVGRLEDLAGGFLQLARPRETRRQAVAIAPLLQAAIELVEHRASERDVRVTCAPDPVRAVALADPDRLRQALLNLLVNAIEASHDGGEVRIAVARECATDGRPEIVVRVCDGGVGVPDRIRARLFEPFATTKPQGTGLGLAIAAEIAAEHDGRLELERSGGEGSVFAIRLPEAATP